MPDILVDKTIDYLFHSKGENKRKLTKIVLGSYFTVVELADKSVGAAMSYYDASLLIDNGISNKINELIKQDPETLCFAEGYMHSCFSQWKSNPHFIRASDSIRCAIASAYSLPYLSSSVHGEFQIRETRPELKDVFETNSALVIGFGGYLPFLIKETEFNNIDVCDFSYKSRFEEMNDAVTGWLANHPNKKVTFFDNFKAHAKNKYDLLSISGSSLCNGTLTELLKAHHESYIILQGQSASIHPKFVFEAGVDLIVTTVKPHNIVEEAEKDYSGKLLTKYFEGGLPFKYLLPSL